jgi:hypothetical protein
LVRRTPSLDKNGGNSEFDVTDSLRGKKYKLLITYKLREAIGAKYALHKEGCG